MNRKIANELELLNKSTKENNKEDRSIIVEEDLEKLPTSVKEWLKDVGIVGKDKITRVTFSQRGK